MKRIILSAGLVLMSFVFVNLLSSFNLKEDQISDGYFQEEYEVKSNNKDAADEYVRVLVMDRVKINDIARAHGLDSALRLLGYNTGGSYIGFYDKQLMNDLLGLVEGSGPAKSILLFLQEYYQYPEINKVQYKQILSNYLSKWMEQTNVQVDEYLYEEILAVMVDCGGVDMQEMVNKSFHYWVKQAKHLKHKIDQAHEDANTYLYQKTCQNAYYAQFALKQLKSSYFKQNEFISYRDISESKDQVPNFQVEKFESYSIDKIIVGENETKVANKNMTTLNDLLNFDQASLATIFDQKVVEGCNTNTLIFVNQNIGFILEVSDCNDDNCQKCHQYGTIKSIKKISSKAMRLNLIASWS